MLDRADDIGRHAVEIGHSSGPLIISPGWPAASIAMSNGINDQLLQPCSLKFAFGVPAPPPE